MLRNSLRLVLAFIFFINIFTPSLLQAQQFSPRREITSRRFSRSPELERLRQDKFVIPQDNTRVVNPRLEVLKRRRGTPPPNTPSKYELENSLLERTPKRIIVTSQETQLKDGLKGIEIRDEIQIKINMPSKIQLQLPGMPISMEQYERENEILRQAGIYALGNFIPNSTPVEVDYVDAKLIWQAEEILRLRKEGLADYSRDEMGRPVDKYKAMQEQQWIESEVFGGMVPAGPYFPQERAREELKKPITPEKNILEEMFLNNDLHIGWMKYFISRNEEYKKINLFNLPEHRKYFISIDSMPGHVKKWYQNSQKLFNEGNLEILDDQYAQKILNKYSYRQSAKEQSAEAALYFMTLLDPQEFDSFSGEERDFIIQEFFEVEKILKKRLYSIKGKTWEDVNARGALRLALWNLYKFYYQTGIKETSGMEAPLEELLKGMQIGRSYYKHTAFSFPKEHYQPAKVFPLAEEGSFGDKLCKEAIEDAKSVDGNQEVYHTALQYATLLLMQAKGNILPLMRYVDQNKGSVDLTSPVVADTMVVLQTAASEAYQDPFKLALFISALRILSAPVEFSMRTRLSAVEHAYNLLSTNYNIPTALQDDKIKNFLTQNKSYFAEMIAKLYCTMLYTYKTNDEFELDSENFETVVYSLGTMYEKLYFPHGYIKATGSSLFDGPIDKERPYCKWEDAGTILKNKSIDEAMDTIATFVIDAALWIVGGWLVGIVFKGASIVIRSSWVALKSTPKAVAALNTARKGRKITAAVIEYKKAYRYSNYMRNVAKNSTITQTYTRANAAARTGKGASSAQQGGRAATTVTTSSGKGATAITSTTSQGAKGAGTATSASAGASSAASGSATSTVSRETTRAVTKKSQLIYSDWNPFRNPKQLTNLTRTEYRPFTNEPLTWRLTDESLALFNAERGIRNYDILRKMRGVDQFGNTMKFFEPLPASRLFSFNPTIAQREFGVLSQYIQSGGLKELKVWGLTESGKLVPVVDGPWAKMMGNPLITRVFAADQGFAKLALNKPTYFMKLAASPNKPAVGLISELSFPFSSESIALSFLRKGYGLSGKNLFTKALLPTSWKTLPMAEWNYIKSSWKPTLKFFGAWEAGDVLAKPLVTQWREDALSSLADEAMAPYSHIFDEASQWNQTLKELNDKSFSAQPASAHLASDLADNNKDPEYLFPLLAGGIGTGLDYVDIWKDIPIIGNMTDWIGKSLMSLGQGISSVPGGEYLSLPFILTSLPFQGAEPLKMMGGLEFPQEAKDMLKAQSEHQAWNSRTNTNRIKHSYRKMADSMYEKAVQAIQTNIPGNHQKDFMPLVQDYRKALIKAVQNPETANDIKPISEKFFQDVWLLQQEINFRELKDLVKENLNTKQRKPVLAKIDDAMREIDAIGQGKSILSETEKAEKEQLLTNMYGDAVLALNEQTYIANITQQIEDPENQAYYIKFVHSSFAKVSQNIQPDNFEDLLQALETNLSNGFNVLEFWLYYKNAFVAKQYQARELGDEELLGGIEQTLGKIEEYLNNPKPLTLEQKIEIANTYNTLNSKLEKALEQNIKLWEKGILEDIGSIGTKALAYIGSWQNKEAIKEGKAAIESFVQQATKVVKEEGLIPAKNEQLKQLLEGLYARLEGIYKEKELHQEMKEELLPSSDTDLNTQAY